MNSVPARELKQLLDQALRYQSVEHALRGRSDIAALSRRINEIRHGRCQSVTLRVADNICTAFGRPDWLQLLDDV